MNQKKRRVLSKFTILYRAAFIAILGGMRPVGFGLDTPACTQRARPNRLGMEIFCPILHNIW